MFLLQRNDVEQVGDTELRALSTVDLKRALEDVQLLGGTLPYWFLVRIPVPTKEVGSHAGLGRVLVANEHGEVGTIGQSTVWGQRVFCFWHGHRDRWRCRQHHLLCFLC